jgi:uncharacterized protein (TIGR02265 family)
MAQFIKGITLKSRLAFVEHAYGRGAIDKVIPHLRGETKILISEPLRIKATAWYGFNLQMELDRAVCKVLARGDSNVYRSMGAFSADYQDKQFSVRQNTDPWRLLNLIAITYNRFFRPGRSEVIKVSDTEATIFIHDFLSTKENCEGNMGFLKRSLEMSGAKDVEVTEQHCSARNSELPCEYHIKWHS